MITNGTSKPQSLTVRVCDSVSCQLNGADELIENLENYYKPINRTFFQNIDLTTMDEPHREFLFRVSVKISLTIANQILKNNFLPNAIDYEDFGRLTLENMMINYPVIFD